MYNDRPNYDDEIDMFDFFETLWDGKWKIIAITFFTALIGIVYSAVKPNSFEVSSPLQRGSPSNFLKYTSLNTLLKQKGLIFDKKLNVNGYQFNSEVVFDMFVFEFGDYEEMMEVLSENDFVKNSLEDLDGIIKQRTLIAFAKSFQIIRPKQRENDWVLKFKWHDDLEGIQLFKKAIDKTLINIKKTSKNNIDKLAKAVRFQNSVELSNHYRELENIKAELSFENQKVLNFLKEQSSIAKKLGIESNRLKIADFPPSVESKKSLTIDQNEFPYYLQGYKVIDKQIAIMESRSAEEQLFLSSNYIIVRNKIITLENDMSPSQLETVSKLIETDDEKNWIEFNFLLADINPLKKTYMYIILSIVLGGVAGSIFVIILNVIRKRKDRHVKA